MLRPRKNWYVLQLKNVTIREGDLYHLQSVDFKLFKKIYVNIVQTVLEVMQFKK